MPARAVTGDKLLDIAPLDKPPAKKRKTLLSLDGYDDDCSTLLPHDSSESTRQTTLLDEDADMMKNLDGFDIFKDDENWSDSEQDGFDVQDSPSFAASENQQVHVHCGSVPTDDVADDDFGSLFSDVGNVDFGPGDMDMDQNEGGNQLASLSDQADPAEAMHVPPIAPHAPLVALKSSKETKTKHYGSSDMERGIVKEACAGMLVSRALFLLVQSDMFHKIRNGASFTSINCTRIVADNHSLYRKAVTAGYALLKESDRRELINGAWNGDEAKAMTVFSEIDELIKEMTARMQQKEKVNGQRQPFVISVAKIITRYEGVQAKKFAITKDALDLWKLERFLPLPKSAFLSEGQQSLREWISNGRLPSNALQSKGGIVDCQIVEGRKLKGQQDDSIEVLEESMALISIGKVNDGKIIEGCLTYNNGSSYTGSFLNGLMHGPGRLVFSNGSVYQGEFQNNFFHGNGKTFMSHGDWYEGTWKNDEWVIGRGRCVVATDTVVEGEFKSGIFHGYGGVALCEGNWLKGTWENNKWVTGEGRLVNFDGTVFEGTFENGIFRGRISWSIGNWYKGSWENTLNVRSHGRIVSSDDIVFEGRFENGVFQGEVSCSNANWYKGPWADALIEETYGQYASADGSVYQGKLKDGHCHGYGKLSWDNGEMYEGNFYMNTYEGHGIWTSCTGDRYEGEFQAGEFHGHGKLTLIDGESYKGIFVKGEFVDGIHTEAHTSVFEVCESEELE